MIKFLISFLKELVVDVAHVVRHRLWIYRDDNKHWHCTLCNVDISKVRSKFPE